MKDENRFTAELYARLWPWLNHSKPTRLMLDDGGQCEVAHPDICVYFDGSDEEMRTECKVLDARGQNKNCVEPTEKQLRTWSQDAHLSGRPHLWAAKVEDTQNYYLWTHEDFKKGFDGRAVAGTTRRAVKIPCNGTPPLTFTLLFLKIMEFAVTKGFLN